MRNRTGFTARFAPVGRTPAEPNKAEEGSGSSRSHPPRESLANWLRSPVGRYRHVGHTGDVCGLVRPSAAPSQVDGRSWERPFYA